MRPFTIQLLALTLLEQPNTLGVGAIVGLARLQSACAKQQLFSHNPGELQHSSSSVTSAQTKLENTSSTVLQISNDGELVGVKEGLVLGDSVGEDVVGIAEGIVEGFFDGLREGAVVVG